MVKKIITLCAIGSLLIACTEKKTKISIPHLAETSLNYVKKIHSLESRLDPTNIDAFMQINDSIDLVQKQADSAIIALFNTNNDSIYLQFNQTKNLERIKILKVWVIGAKYNELHIQALVKALDNSSFQGPYTSASIFDKDNKRIEVGGGIGGDADKKLIAGETYIFNGKIDNLHKLENLKSLSFDEDIKKW